MRVVETAVYRGPHRYGAQRMVRVRVDLGALEEWPSNCIPGFAATLESLLPGLQGHGCSVGRPGGFVARLHDGTWMGHIVEHVALELQTMCGFRTTRGKTRGVVGSPGRYDVLVSYEDAEVALAAVGVALRTVVGLLPEGLQDLDTGRLRVPEVADADGRIPGLTALRALASRRRLGPTTASIVEAARRRGIPVHVTGEGSSVRLGYGVHQRRFRASITDATSHLAVELAADKQRTRERLRRAGVPVPAGEAVTTADEAVAVARRFAGPAVVKPLAGNHGRGITIGVRTEEEVREAVERAQRHGRRVVVEELVEGRDYRALVVDGKLVAVAERRPAHVVGDGRHTIAELVELTNADPRRGQGHERVLTRIRLDDDADRVLASQGLTRADVPEARRTVLLARTGNLSTGGDAVDRTDAVHPRNVVVLERAARAIGLDIAGLDVVCPDIALPWDVVGGAVLEVNAAPGFRMHLAPTEGEPRDVARDVISMLYPPGTSSLIPVVAVTGTNGKSTTVRMLASILMAAGRHVGMTTTSGIYLDGHLVEAGDSSGPRSAQRVLDDPMVEVAVLETARGGMLREGLAVPRLDVGVVLNVTADHLGLGGVDDLDELARVKGIVARSVRRNGLSLLNADDPRVARMASRAGGRVGWFTLEPPTAKLVERLAHGDLVASLEHNMLVIRDGAGLRHMLLAASDIPATVGGAARFNVQNALAAAAAAFALGVPPTLIADALRDFDSSFEQNPGRLNLTRVTGFTTIIDYGHNPAALTALGELLREMRRDHDRLIGVVSTPGDRRDADILELGRIAAGVFDQLVFRERPDGRGRAPGGVVELLQRGALEAGADPSSIVIEMEELAAMECALSAAGPRDLVVLLPTDVEGAWRLVHDFAARHLDAGLVASRDGMDAPRRERADDGQREPAALHG